MSVNLGKQGFAINSSLCVWLNGKPVHQGKIDKASEARRCTADGTCSFSEAAILPGSGSSPLT